MSALPEQVTLRLEVCEPLALPRLDQSEGSSGSRDRCPPITAHLAALQLTLPRRVRPRVAHDVALRQLARPLLYSRYIYVDRYILSTAGISTLKSAQLQAEASEDPRLAARRRRQESNEVAITVLLGTHNTTHGVHGDR